MNLKNNLTKLFEIMFFLINLKKFALRFHNLYLSLACLWLNPFIIVSV